MSTSSEPLRSVWIHAFRGKREDLHFVDRCRGRAKPPPSLDECLIYAGHVGVSFDGERPIYGFLPLAPHLAPEVLLDRLQQGSIFAGEVAEHTSIFDSALRHGLQVVQVEYHYRESAQQSAYEEVQAQLKNCTLTYSFPGQGGDCNCATWLGHIGLQLPEPTGQMKLFVRALEMLKVNSPVAVG